MIACNLPYYIVSEGLSCDELKSNSSVWKEMAHTVGRKDIILFLKNIFQAKDIT